MTNNSKRTDGILVNTTESLNFCALVTAFWQQLTDMRKKQLFLLLLLMLGASFAEVLSLGAVLPFLGVLTEPDRLYHSPAIQPLISWLKIDSSQMLLMPMTVVFILGAVFASAMRMLLLYVNTRLSFAIGGDFSCQVYRATLYQPYSKHISRNTSKVISVAATKVNILVYHFLVPLLMLISSTIIIAVAMVVMLYLYFSIAAATFLGFGLIYGAVILITRKHILASGRQIADENVRVVKILQEGLGGIRDVIIDNTQEVYFRQYKKAEDGLRHAQASSAFIAGSPRFIAEPIGMVFIAVLAYVMTVQNSGLSNAIILLGALAMGAQRLLPLLQQAYSSNIQIRSNLHAVYDVLDILSTARMPDARLGSLNELQFKRGIELKNLGYSYSPESDSVLQNINLYIAKGSRVGFIGATGSGKSTLLDIVMGLLSPTIGEVLIDDVALKKEIQNSWRSRIAHVPQSIYLSDSSIYENIAFGVPVAQIDLNRVYESARQAQIADYIETLPCRYNTNVGERGVRLSGGQLQRIGIARALYKQAEVIIFDEATSSLDSETEMAVMDAIGNLSSNLTVLIIAHRLSTLKGCSQIVKIDRGEIERVTTYEDLIEGIYADDTKQNL